jgi:hypothetical protein
VDWIAAKRRDRQASVREEIKHGAADAAEVQLDHLYIYGESESGL